ncbi:hypothetical protein BH24ACT12_BH24ACT12_12020 [soil metagenome]|jgi:hypothetical protein
MKKALLVVVLAVGAGLGLRRARAGQAEADLWAEATDTVPRSTGR